MTLAEIREAMAVLNTFVHKSAIVIFGSAISEEMGDEVRVTLVATGLDSPLEATAQPVVFDPTLVTEPKPTDVTPVSPVEPAKKPAEPFDPSQIVIPSFLK